MSFFSLPIEIQDHILDFIVPSSQSWESKGEVTSKGEVKSYGREIKSISLASKGLRGVCFSRAQLIKVIFKYFGMPKEVVKALGGYNRIGQFPRLDIGERVRDYIDFLKVSEVKNPVSKGVDQACRPFVVLKIKMNEKKCILTLFKRYTDGDTWVSCFSHPHASPERDILGSRFYSVGMGCIRGPEFGQFITALLSKEPLVVKEGEKSVRVELAK